MRFDPVLADIRFGCGLSPAIPPAPDADAMLATLQADDIAADRFPIAPFSDLLARWTKQRAQVDIRRANRGTAKGNAAHLEIKRLNARARRDQLTWFWQHLMRRAWSPHPFRERLVFFWTDHFTATGKTGVLSRGTSPYMESALRPHIAGRFEDLLIAAIQHPLMLHYLDQTRSIGPDSLYARKRNKVLGLNENLAREVMELHSLGVDGPYTQTDVSELAELFTGMTLHRKKGFDFRRDFAQPGAETVLGRSYGGGRSSARDIRSALRDLARHPATARHIARKLAVHFVSDTPEPELIDALATRFLATRGHLQSVYAALLEHPAAWADSGANVKKPMDFIGSALRALAVPAQRPAAFDFAQIRLHLLRPMALMGHVWETPDGPDGLPENDADWITPQGLAARLQWAVSVPQILRPDLPDPRDFVQTALGGRAPPAVRFAAEAAESRWDGIGLVLASPAFQRM